MRSSIAVWNWLALDMGLGLMFVPLILFLLLVVVILGARRVANQQQSDGTAWPESAVCHRLPVYVARGYTSSRIREALLQAAHSRPEIHLNPAPAVFFMGAVSGESEQYELRVWTAHIREDIRPFISNLYRAMFASLRSYGVPIRLPPVPDQPETGELEKRGTYDTANVT